MIEHESGLGLLNQLLRGRISRRDALKRGAAIGLSASALGTLAQIGGEAALAQDATPTAAAPAGEIVWALDTTVPNIIPFGGIALAQWQGKEFLYDSLLAWDADLKVIPALAESYETPDDLTYIFHLRQGVKFHNGNEMTSKDVVYSITTALNPPEPGVKVPYLGNVVSAEAVDDYTVKIIMSKLDPTLVGTLAWTNYTSIVPEGLLEQVNVLSEGIGTGPFKLVEYSQDDQIVYEAFPDFWGNGSGAPGVQKLTLKMLTDEQARVAALRSGETIGSTFTADVASTLASDEITVLNGLTSAPKVIQFSMVNDVPWRDKRVRQAISLVVDRQEIIDKVYGGQAVVTGAIPPGYGDWPLADDVVAAAYANDVEKAKQLMADAGFADGFDVKLQAIAAPHEYVQISEIVQQSVKQLNINVSVEPLEIGTFAANIGSGEFEWASTGRGMRGDPSGHVVDFRSGTANNVVWFGDGWKNDEIDALYDQGLAELDQAKRHDIYNQIQTLLLDEMPNMYTVVSYKYQAVNNALHGMYVFYGNTNPGLRTVTVTE